MARRKKLQVEEKKERRLPTTRYNPEYKKGLTSQFPDNVTRGLIK